MPRLLRSAAVPVFAIALFGLVATGCFRHNYGPTPSPPLRPAQVVKWNHNVLFGLIGINSHTSPGDVCGGPPAYVQNYVGIAGLLLGVITVGMYIPTTTRVWCAGPRAESPGAAQTATAHR